MTALLRQSFVSTSILVYRRNIFSLLFQIVTSQQRAAKRASPLYPLVTLCYYLIGESVPSIFVLICLREMPVGGVKGTRRGSLSSLTSLDEISQPLLSPAPNGLLPGPAPQPAVAPWIASPPVPPEPGEKPGRGTSSTLEHPRRAKAHALGSKRPIGERKARFSVCSGLTMLPIRLSCFLVMLVVLQEASRELLELRPGSRSS